MSKDNDILGLRAQIIANCAFLCQLLNPDYTDDNNIKIIVMEISHSDRKGKFIATCLYWGKDAPPWRLVVQHKFSSDTIVEALQKLLVAFSTALATAFEKMPFKWSPGAEVKSLPGGGQMDLNGASGR